MYNQHDTATGEAVLDGGVTAGVPTNRLSALGELVDALVEAQRRRDDYLAGLLAEAEGTCDYRWLDEATADSNAAANSDLDQLLVALRRAGIGTAAAAIDPEDNPRVRELNADAWARAGYTSPDAAAEWTAIGIDTPDVAQQWVRAGFTAESASLWVEVPDMTPSEAATCANAGMTPVDVERIRRADPGWTRPEPPPPASPGWAITG